VVEEGRKAYPNEKNLAMEELDLYFSMGRGNEAKSKLEEALRMDSTNANIHSILGNMYDQEAADAKRQQKDRDASKARAIASYKKAIRFDPSNMESNFNLGVYHFNKAADILKKVNDMDMNTYQKKGKAMEAEAQKEFGNALPYFETCYKKDPYDVSSCKSLKSTYSRLGREGDADKLNCIEASSVGEIPLTPKGGIFELDAVINGIPLKIYFDPGAADVSLSISEAMVMIKQGKISNEDILGDVKFSDANGDLSDGTQINLKSVKIGQFEQRNVKASVIHNLSAPLLLGQSFLKRFSKYEVDNKRQVLILKN
jgi:clan AA aspartic protease (TIGR02281 family)